MAINKKPHFRGSDFNNQELKDAKSLQLNQDAVSADEAVRKAQAEAIADQASQDILISLTASASNDTAFTSQSMMGFLGNKQDNMEIDASSAAYLQIVDGYKIKVSQLLIVSTEVDETYTDLVSYLAGVNPTKQEGDVVILNAATDNQQRSWIKTGSASQGADGYTRLQTDYNVVSIRAMFSAANYLSYDQSSGQFGLVLGNGAGQLGAHTLPIDSTQFTSITGSSIGEIAKKLEELIISVQTASNDGTSVVNTRLSTLSGVTGNSLETFNGLFSDNTTVKAIFVESEALHQAAITDRAAIRNEFASADTGLQNNIDAEVSARISAVSQEASARQTQDAILQGNIDAANGAVSTEQARATAAEGALDARLDVVEGSASVSGSIAKAQADAQMFASNIVTGEAIARQISDANLQSQIDSISSAFLYKGYIGSDGRIVHIDPLSGNHNVPFENAALFNGDFYKSNADITITFSDSSSITLNSGDGILAIADVAAGFSKASDFHKTDNTEAADILREGMLDGVTVEKVAGSIQVKDDSIDRAKLDDAVEADIDSKVEKAGDTMTGALKIDKVVGNGVGHVGGYDYAAHVKQKSVDTDSLTDTQRALLVENDVYTGGSGDITDLDYAKALEVISKYQGSSNDMSVATIGVDGEAKVYSSIASVYATGVYGEASDDQLGVNAGGTFVAQNASTSNLGVFGFSDTAGALNNRGGYFALAPDNVDLDAYRIARVSSPLPVQDAALIIDDYTGQKHALFVKGKSEFDGKVIVPTATADDEAVNLGDVKAKEFYDTFTVGADASTIINHQLGSKKVIVQLWLDDEEVTSSFDVEKSSDNSITVYNDSESSISNLEICIIKLSV